VNHLSEIKKANGGSSTLFLPNGSPSKQRPLSMIKKKIKLNNFKKDYIAHRNSLNISTGECLQQ
jgi:hypothetical protein